MTWKSESGKDYKLCLIDTNIISEVVKNPEVEGKGFIKLFPPNCYAPCISFFSLLELKRRKDLFQKFISFFSEYPCFLLKPHKLILDEERKARGDVSLVQPLQNAFSFLGSESSFDIKYFTDEMFSLKFFDDLARNWRNEEEEILNGWLARKENFEPSKSSPNSEDAEEYLFQAGMQSLINSDLDWAGQEIQAGRMLNVFHFPSLRFFLYSQYYRLYDPYWKAKAKEVTDVLIYSVAPYMDVVIAERYQAEIFRKTRARIAELTDTEVYILRDLRVKVKTNV